MGERNHTTGGASSAPRWKWTLIIIGTAVVLMAAGVAIQVTRPTSAYPEDGTGKGSQAGRASTGQQPKSAKQAAKVTSHGGTEYISHEELAAECISRHGEEILENLINRKIIQQACNAAGVEISEAEVEAEIAKIARNFKVDPIEWQKHLQATRNVSPAQYRRDIIWPMLALKKLAGEEVQITQQDLKRAFERNYGPRVKARAIVLDNPRRANEAWKKATDDPENFDRVAREFSIDQSSRSLGGVIPPIAKHSGSLELEKAAFKLQEGEISGIIQVGAGNGSGQWVILMCEGRTEPVVTKIDEVKDILEQELREEKIQEAVALTFKEIQDAARVDNYLTHVSSGGERKPVGGQATSKAAGKTGAVRPAGATGAPRKATRPIAEIDADAEPEETDVPPAQAKPAARPAKKTR